MNIYVGNLPYSISENDLRDMFAKFGEVGKANIIMDRDSGRSKGFGFVEMPNQSEAEAAIGKLNETEYEGRNMRVNEARPRPERRF